MEILKAAVIGDPISHSLSPQLHNFLLKQYKINGSYKAINLKKDEIYDFIASFQNDKNFRGFNVTIPYKEIFYKIAKEMNFIICESAESIKSINTVYKQENKVYVSNSDTFGFLENIKINFPEYINKKTALVYGSGGASRAVIYSLLKNNYRNIIIVNRTLSKAKEVAEHFTSLFPSKNIIINCYTDINKEILEDIDIFINTTSLGMKSNNDLIIDFKNQNLNKEILFYDIVYNPLMTKMLIDAQNNGNKILTGIGMLIYQAFEGFEKWFGVKPKLTPSQQKNISQILIDKLNKNS